MRWPFSARRPSGELPPQDAYALWAASYPPHPHNRLMEVEQAAMVEALPDLAGRRALDAGCGTGRYLQVMADRGAIATGVDLSAPMLARARRVSGRLVRGSLHALPLQSGAIDVAVCGLALGDVDDLARAIGELARVLRPGGRLIYSVVHPRGAAARWSRTFESGGESRAVAGFWHSANEHRAACAAAGLTIEAWREPHCGDRRPVALVVRAVASATPLVEAAR